MGEVVAAASRVPTSTSMSMRLVIVSWTAYL
jgi:hypothetical protein